MLETTSSVDAHARIEQLESLLSQRTAEIEARDLRIRLLEEALRVLKADKCTGIARAPHHREVC